MKAMKGLFLGTAAGLFAVASAQAADLPVKAKPVEYVKVCSLYGAGFFYVPGTDTCLKIGMYLRSDHGYGNALNVNGVYQTSGNQTRSGQDYYTYRARINLTTDWRTQSDYGVIRAYAAIIAQQGTADQSPNNPPGLATANGLAGILRAFIQFAGFTFGHAVSYFEFTNYADYGYEAPFFASSGVNGIDLIAYTWQLGNGWSASVDVEDGNYGRNKILLNANAAAMIAANGATQGAGSFSNNASTMRAWSLVVVANIRIDQAWGSAQISGALHNASAGYYGSSSGPFVSSNGHPADVWGWAVQGGFRLLNFLAPKDSFEGAIAYGKGATGYILGNPTNYTYGSGNSIGAAWASDGVFANGGSIELTETWTISAAYQHYWSDKWRSSVFGGYTQTNYSGTAKTTLCGTPGQGFLGGGFNAAFSLNAGATCNPDFSQWSISTRTAWNPHPSLEIGLDLIFWHLDTSMAGTATLVANGARPAGIYNFADQDRLGAVFRVQKTILP